MWELKATFDISSSHSKMPANIKPYLLVLHECTGCDTTSAIHSKWKTLLTKILEVSQHLWSLMDVLSDRNADQADVDDVRIQLFLYMYGRNQTLSKLLYVYLRYLTLWMPLMYRNTNERSISATKVAEIERSSVFQYIIDIQLVKRSHLQRYTSA